MTKLQRCVQIEPDLIATATGEATETAAAEVQSHVAGCAPCREDFARYRAVDAVVGTLRADMPVAGDADAARQRLVARLADLKSRLVSYRAFPSPLGPILIAASEHGVALVEYLDQGGVADSRLFRMADVETQEDAGELSRLHQELLDYLAGRRTRLEWPLDLRFARSEFERSVLRATSAVPYGALSSYTGIAGDLGKPRAMRAVAQALRHNPLPIVVPCPRRRRRADPARGRHPHRARRDVPLRSESRPAVLPADLRQHHHASARRRDAVLAARAGGSDRPRALPGLPPRSSSARRLGSVRRFTNDLLQCHTGRGGRSWKRWWD
jgi:methylated-DNA-[protein]-cysteine S-methyltransferase